MILSLISDKFLKLGLQSFEELSSFHLKLIGWFTQNYSISFLGNENSKKKLILIGNISNFSMGHFFSKLIKKTMNLY